MEEGIVPEGGTKGGFVGFWYIAESPAKPSMLQFTLHPRLRGLFL